MSTLRVGQIGLGNLGFLMARSIINKGFHFTVCDVRPEPVEEMKAMGAIAANTPRDVAAASDIIVSIVNDIEDTENIIFGKDGMLESIRKGSAIILASTIGPNYVKTVYDRTKERDIRIIDAGMSKEGSGEEIGGLTIMVGGEKADVDYCRPVLDAMAKHVFHVGPIGTGQAFKIVNNLLSLAQGTLTREALNVGVKAGLDLQMMIDVMKVSTGGNWNLNYMDFQRKSKSGVTGTPAPIRRLVPTKNIGLKDWTLARDYAEAVGAKIPITSLIHELDARLLYSALAEVERRG